MHNDVWIEHRHHGLEIAGAQSRKKRIDNTALLLKLSRRRSVSLPHASARAAGQLPRGVRRASYDAADFVKGNVEHIVQNKSETLRRAQPVQHDKERETARIGQQRFLFRVNTLASSSDRFAGFRVLARSMVVASVWTWISA